MRNDIVPAPVQEKILYVFSAFFDKFEPCFGGEFRIFRAVFADYGYNNIAQYGATNPSDLIGGCTLENPDKIVFIDELDDRIR